MELKLLKLIVKQTIKIVISLFIICFLVRMYFKLFDIQIPSEILEEYFKLYDKTPNKLKKIISKIIYYFEEIEFLLWLIMFLFFTSFIEIFLYVSLVPAKDHPYDLSVLLMVFVLLSILWIFWVKK